MGWDSVGGLDLAGPEEGTRVGGQDEEGPVRVAQACGAEGLFWAWLE